MKVKFLPQDVEFEIPPGQSLMAFAQEKGIPIRSTCNGMPSCAECRVRIVDGESNVSPPSRKELSLIGTGYYIDQRRLSCQVLCFGDIVVDTSEQIEKSSEGPVTKKFLSRVHKTSAQESHSLGGVLIEQDEALLKQIESAAAQSLAASGGREGRESSASSVDSEGGSEQGRQRAAGQGGGGRDRSESREARGDRGPRGDRGERGGRGRGRNRNRNRNRHRGGGGGGGGGEPRH